MNRRPRVLLIAEACNPTWVSVPLVGWSCSQAIAKLADTHLVTHIRNRQALLDAGLGENDDFTALDSDRIAAPLHWLASKLRGGAGRGWSTVTALRSLAYYYFERLVWKRFGDDIKNRRFDLVHRLTPLTPTAPSLIARRCAHAKVPFILGPLNGGLPWPREFAAARRREGEWLSRFRSLHRWMPGYRSTRQHAAAIVVGSIATWQQVDEQFRDKCVYIPENAVSDDRIQQSHRPSSTRPLRVAFVGRLVDYKNPDVVIEAIAPLARSGNIQLDVIGDGPMRASLEQMIDRLGIRAQVTLHGWVDHEDVSSLLSRCDVFAFPSIREFGGAVVLEAMAAGAVPIVVDYGGPTELISEHSGIRIPLTDRAGLVANLQNSIQAIVNNPATLASLRNAGIERVRRSFTWDAKARQLLQVYEWVLGRRTKPDFGMPFADAINDDKSPIDARSLPHEEPIPYPMAPADAVA